MKIDNTIVTGWDAAIRGMRNPMNSWNRSDTIFEHVNGSDRAVSLGDEDLKLMLMLSKAGSEHAKYKRMINVTCDIIAPVYFVAELDTYKIGTTRNSCSLQHKGSSRDFVTGDFTWDNEFSEGDYEIYEKCRTAIADAIKNINFLRSKYIETDDYKFFRLMRQLMPMGYNYRFTWSANYEVLSNIYHQRKNHPLSEWHKFCDWIESLPYSRVITIK